ncbi:unnamed protein product, partial [Prorocentrum cordatum]
GPTPPNMVPPKEPPPGPPKPVSVQTVQTVLASLAKHIQSGGKAGVPKRGVVVPPPNKGHLVNPKLAGLGQIRAALVSAVFTRLDIDCDEILTPREMRRFAELTGFDGDEEEWNQAFKALMKENGMPDATGSRGGKLRCLPARGALFIQEGRLAPKGLPINRSCCAQA